MAVFFLGSKPPKAGVFKKSETKIGHIEISRKP